MSMVLKKSIFKLSLNPAVNEKNDLKFPAIKEIRKHLKSHLFNLKK